MTRLFPGDHIKITSNRASEDEDYRGQTGYILAEPEPLKPAEPYGLSVLLDDHRDFGAVQFSAEELQLLTPGHAAKMYAELEGQLTRHAQALQDALSRQDQAAILDLSAALNLSLRQRGPAPHPRRES